MQHLVEVPISPAPMERFKAVMGEGYKDVAEALERARATLAGKVIWNVNSTAAGGGVAELLRSLLGYARGAGVDTRWLVIKAPGEFFTVTKLIHNKLHGDSGDGERLGKKARDLYECTLDPCAAELAGMVRPGDVVILHDSQVAGMVGALRDAGAIVVWRCHVGDDIHNNFSREAWSFLEPYIADADAYVFSRSKYVPECIEMDKVEIITPSLDAFSAKNEEMDTETATAILAYVGLVADHDLRTPPVFVREDGTPGRVSHLADVLRLGPPPSFKTPLVVQVSRWDNLKDPIGVLRGFAEHVDPATGAHLVIAGPTVHAVVDDPEGADVLDEAVAAWRTLPHDARSRVDIACLPMLEVEENAAIVNALQRHATVIVQKSIREGFGLTVTEAMWKGKPVVASAVGGVQEQIEDGVDGILLPNPLDLETFGKEVTRVLRDRKLASRLGEAARRKVRQTFLGSQELVRFQQLIERLIGKAPGTASLHALPRRG